MKNRTNAHYLSKSDLAVIKFLIAALEPLGKIDVSRHCPPASVKRLFEDGHLHEAISSDGQACVVVAPLTLKELRDRPPWLPTQDTTLRAAWRKGEAVHAIAEQLGRTGGEVLSRAWELDLAQRPKRCPKTDLAVPAWRVRRLRWALLDAERRGIDPQDEGTGLEHRALQRRFQSARKAVLAIKRRTQRAWRMPDKLALRSLIRDGQTLRMMATVFGRRIEDIAHQVAVEGRHIAGRWTEDEDRTLVDALKSGISEEGAAKLLPNRTIIAVYGRARQLLPEMFPSKKPAGWSEAETRKLIDGYERGLRGLALYKQFPGRSWQAARRHLHKIKFHHDKDAPATVTEVRILNAAFSRGDSDIDIARFLVWRVERVARFRKAQSRMRGGGREPKLNKVQISKLIKMKADPNTSDRLACEELGISASTFYRYARIHGAWEGL